MQINGYLIKKTFKNKLLNILPIVLFLVFSVSAIIFICHMICPTRLEKPIEIETERSVEKSQVDFYAEKNIIAIKKTYSLDFDINNVKINDEYNNLKFSFVLNGDYLSSFNEVNYDFKNNIYNGFNISNNENNLTVLTISEKDIFAFKLYDDKEYYYIEGAPVKEIYNNIVVLDPGHGGVDPGCEAFGASEKDICLDIALKAEKYINDSGIAKAYLTRKSDESKELEQRVEFAEKFGDILVSVHVNYNEYYFSAAGTEVYYYNKNYEKPQFIRSDECAEFLCNSISMNFGSRRRENKVENYFVIKATDIPSVLCEVGFLSNKAEADKLKSEDGRDKIAKGISDGVVSIFKLVEYNKNNTSNN